MTTKAEKEAEMLRAVLAYQKDTAKIAKSIARATIDAVNELKGDAEAIFSTFLLKGGLTREEAERIMSKPITEAVRRRLIERARRTYEGADLRKALVRLSSRSHRHRMDNAEALRSRPLKFDNTLKPQKSSHSKFRNSIHRNPYL